MDTATAPLLFAAGRVDAGTGPWGGASDTATVCSGVTDLLSEFVPGDVVQAELQREDYIDFFLDTGIDWDAQGRPHVVVRRYDPHMGQQPARPMPPPPEATRDPDVDEAAGIAAVGGARRRRPPIVIHPMDDIARLIDAEAQRIDYEDDVADGNEYAVGRVSRDDFPRSALHGEVTSAVRRALREWRGFRDTFASALRAALAARLDVVHASLALGRRGGARHDAAAGADDTASCRRFIKAMLAQQEKWDAFVDTCAFHEENVVAQRDAEAREVATCTRLLRAFAQTDELSSAVSLVEMLWEKINARRKDKRLYRDAHTRAYNETMQALGEHASFVLGVYADVMRQVLPRLRAVQDNASRADACHAEIVRSAVQGAREASQRLRGVLRAFAEELVATGDEDAWRMVRKWLGAAGPDAGDPDAVTTGLAMTFRLMKRQVKRMADFAAGVTVEGAQAGLLDINDLLEPASGGDGGGDDGGDGGSAGGSEPAAGADTDPGATPQAAACAKRAADGCVARLEGEIARLHEALGECFNEAILGAKSHTKAELEKVLQRCLDQQRELQRRLDAQNEALQRALARMERGARAAGGSVEPGAGVPPPPRVPLTARRLATIRRQLDGALEALRMTVTEALAAGHGARALAERLRGEPAAFSRTRIRMALEEYDRMRRELVEEDRRRNAELRPLASKEAECNGVIEALFAALTRLHAKIIGRDGDRIDITTRPEIILRITNALRSLKAYYSYAELADAIEFVRGVSQCAAARTRFLMQAAAGGLEGRPDLDVLRH